MARRVLYVSAVGVIGGAEQSLLQLVRALDRSHFEPLAAVPAGPLAEALHAAGVQVFHVPPRRLRKTLCPAMLLATCARLTRDAMRLARIIRMREVSLVHSNTTTAHLIGAPAAAIAHVPAIWHVRDLQTASAVRCLLRPLTAETICISGAVRSGLGLPARVIPNGIAADEFERSARPGILRAELGLPSGRDLVVMAAQMVPWKGHATLIHALDILRSARGNFTAAIAGEDMFGEHADYVAVLRDEVEELALENCVRFLGYRPDVASLMSDADVVVVPSDAEPSGRVALEAMALGKPVVGTAAGGLPEVLVDGETGILVPPRDPRSLAGALRALLDDKALARQLGENGRRRVREYFSAARHAADIQELYDRILPRQ